jgi:mRNA interferase RelE/StbE
LAPYRIVVTETATRDVNRLDADTCKRIAQKLPVFAMDPLAYARKLTNPKIGTYRFRVGDHRIIFDLVGGDLVILRIGHRKEIYR